MADTKISALSEAANLTSAHMSGIQSGSNKKFPASLFAAASDLSSYVTSSALTTTLSDYATTSGLHAVATSGDYDDLDNTPTLATVATSNDYDDLDNTPTLATVAGTGAYGDLSGTPTLATIATSGLYSDLTGAPSLGAVATSNSYNDLDDKPATGAGDFVGPGSSTSGNLVGFSSGTGKAGQDSGIAAADVVVDSDLGAVATSNDYDDLDNTPPTYNPGAGDLQSRLTGSQDDKWDSAAIKAYEGYEAVAPSSAVATLPWGAGVSRNFSVACTDASTEINAGTVPAGAKGITGNLYISNDGGGARGVTWDGFLATDTLTETLGTADDDYAQLRYHVNAAGDVWVEPVGAISTASVTLVATADYHNSTAGAETDKEITLPTGTAEGDLIIAVINNSGALHATWPGDWTQMNNEIDRVSTTPGEGFYLDVGKIDVDGPMVSAGVVDIGTLARYSTVILVTLRGVDTLVYDDAGGGSQSSGTGFNRAGSLNANTVTHYQETSTVNSSLALAFVSCGYGTRTIDFGSGWTEEVETASTAGNSARYMLYLGSREMPTAGTTPAGTFTMSGASNLTLITGTVIAQP